ncbi:MAG: serine hydrolase [Verrucomicrobiales bacterium]|nr:serine hydrolase [Verrucomicrobiales bacterium]
MNKNLDPSPILKKSLGELGCKGILLAISENGTIRTFSAGSILADDHDRPYYIYSISKSFTAVAIMQLCEEQGGFLDKRFSSFFPKTPIPHAITVQQLLNHTSGLSDYLSSPKYQQALNEHPNQPWTYKKLMKIGLEKTPLFAAGKGWSYSNPGYGLLKELIEKKSGMGYYEYLKKKIIDKIDLADTRPFLKADEQLDLLEGEDDSFAGDFRPQYQPGWIATGCLISTASDVARFYDALFRGELVSKESIAEMVKTVDVFPNPPKESIPSCGLGLLHFRNSPLGDAYGHGGGGPGYTTYAVHFPNLNEKSVSISLVLNRSLPETPFSLADEIVNHYIEAQN